MREDGSTIAQHLRQAGEEVQDRLDPPPGLEFAVSAFVELNAVRNYGFGPNAISYAEVRAWCWIRRVRLEAWEVDIIHSLDQLMLKVMANARSRSTKPRS